MAITVTTTIIITLLLAMSLLSTAEDQELLAQLLEEWLLVQ